MMKKKTSSCLLSISNRDERKKENKDLVAHLTVTVEDSLHISRSLFTHISFSSSSLSFSTSVRS